MQRERADHVYIPVKERLERLSSRPAESCIFRVHDLLRQGNTKAYEPEILAIGPYHHDKVNLQVMEEHKLRYLELLLLRKRESRSDAMKELETYITAIKEMETNIRACYAEAVTMDETEFAEIMVLDGCFIIELFRKNYEHIRDDPIFMIKWMKYSLRRDLMLFENQLPFFVPVRLFDLIVRPTSPHLFINWALHFFGAPDIANEISVGGIKHLLGLMHYRLFLATDIQQGRSRSEDREVANKVNKWKHLRLVRFIQYCSRRFLPWARDVANEQTEWQPAHSATELQEAGIKFKMAEERALVDIKFKDGVMEIPPLLIEDITESLFRNLIAYEQYCLRGSPNYVTDYVLFMDGLINSAMDVGILRRRGIIKNWLGDDKIISTMINKLGHFVNLDTGESRYSQIYIEVNRHCSKYWNVQRAKLRRKYFSSPWTSISVIAAAVLLLLAFAQTAFSVLSFALHHS